MTALIVIAGLLVLAVVALVAYVATRPDTYRVERTTLVHAPSTIVFGIINDLSQWSRWSPYDKRDPNMQKTFKGPAAGLGAIYEWNGNKDVGEGRLAIVDSKSGEYVAMKLEFTRPFQCENDVRFVLAPSPEGTRVSWIMDGKNTLFSKAFSLVMSMDKMVGKDFEDGLSNLNSIAQSDAGGVK